MKRQGDILVIKIDKLPKGLKKVLDGVLVRGEVTGHSHKLVDGGVFKDKNGLLYLVVAKKALLKHEEHKSISLGKGLYKVLRQREYTNKDAVRIVVD